VACLMYAVAVAGFANLAAIAVLLTPTGIVFRTNLELQSCPDELQQRLLMPPLSVPPLLLKGRQGPMLSFKAAPTKSRVWCPQSRRFQPLQPMTPEAFKSADQAQVARTITATTLASIPLSLERRFVGARCVNCTSHFGQSIAVIVVAVSVLMTTIVLGWAAA